MQTGLVQVGLEAGLSCDSTALRTDMRRSVLMDPLMGGHSTRVREHHGRRALRTCLKMGEDKRKIKEKNRLSQLVTTAQNSSTTNAVPSSPRLTELGAALICWKWVTSSALPENCVWHSGHLKLLYCSPSAFLHGRGISACGP